MENRQKEWSGKSRGGSFGYNFFILLIRKLGVRAAYAFLSLVVIYFIPFAPKASRAIWRYNRRILGYGWCRSAVKLYVHYYVFGQTIIDKIAVSNGLSDRYTFEFENYEPVAELLNRKEAVTIIGAHIGCWEIGSEFFREYASKLNVVMYDAEYEKIKEALRTTELRYKIITVNDGGIESLLKIKQAIDSGECVCFQGDRYMDAANACPVDFMGHSALFPKGPSLIAAKFKTPVIIYFAMRERGRKYRFKFTAIESGHTSEQIMHKYVESLETTIKQYEQQWFNFYDVWQQK